MTITRDILHFHLFCGLGGGAKGFNAARPVVGNLRGRMRCIGGVDIDAAAIRDFGRLSGVAGTVLDMFDRQQYRDFHGHEPPPDWREATPADIQCAAGGERPHIVFLSSPCKGLSGLLAESLSKTSKYQALNRLTVRGIWLMLEAWKDDPPEFVIFENVPRIASRGRPLLDQIMGLLASYGYAARETTHDCGKLGALAQSRKRFLLVARHQEKVPPFLYEPAMRPLQAVGSVLGRMLLPGDDRAGPMHRVPSLQWRTWVRLAFVEAGSDWRSLNKLAVQDGILRDWLIVPESTAWHGGVLGVLPWAARAGTVTGSARCSTGAFSVADPRAPAGAAQYQQYGVRRWSEPSGVVSGQSAAGGGCYSVADPRHTGTPKHNNEFRIVPWQQPSQAVTSAHGSGQCVADPRNAGPMFGKYAVTLFDEPAGTVIAGSTTGQGAFAVADPRPPARGKLFTKYPVTEWEQSTGTVIGGDDCGAYAVADPRVMQDRAAGDAYYGGGHYGVLPWDGVAGAVSAAANHDNGRWSVADPRPLPEAADRLVCRITARDGTWHRPFTTLELAALQSLLNPEDQLELDGLSDQAWRERIGNAVPPSAAEAIAGVMGATLLLAWSGETFQLSASPIWVRPIAVAVSLPGAAA